MGFPAEPLKTNVVESIYGYAGGNLANHLSLSKRCEAFSLDLQSYCAQ